MYSFTSLSVKVDHVVAACDRGCDFCKMIGADNLILSGSDYYLLKGLVRTTRRRCFDSPTGFVRYGQTENVDRLCMCRSCLEKSDAEAN